jgi:peptidoglycan hydrolase-like protein with peptidoglycan-binding domain
MAHGVRRWLAGIGVAAAAGALVIGQAGMAGAASVGTATAGTHAARSVTAAGGYLHLGSQGPAVKALQRRLTALHYYLGKIDGQFGWNTMEAVWAFKEVQFGKRTPRHPDIVGSLMWRQLRHPKLPRAHRPHGGAWRVEVNKRIEVLVVYKHDKITLISHVSTAAYSRPDGTGWVTPDGRYRAQEYIAGPVPDSTFGGYMYNPVFFIGRSYAIHGMPNPTSTFSYDGVPLNPASHGCVRIPMDVSVVFHNHVRIGFSHGTPIYIYGPNN